MISLKLLTEDSLLATLSDCMIGLVFMSYSALIAFKTVARCTVGNMVNETTEEYSVMSDGVVDVRAYMGVDATGTQKLAYVGVGQVNNKASRSDVLF